MGELPDPEAVAETRAILRDASLMAALREAEADVKAGRVFSHDEVAGLVRRRAQARVDINDSRPPDYTQ